MPFNKCFPCCKFQNEEIIIKLDFSNAVLMDVFPEVWQYERTLEELYLTSTRITNLPPQLFYCQSLHVLVVSNNDLECIPTAIGALQQLQQLNLARNLISSIPDSIKTCKNLTHLDLSCNNLQRLPDAITCLIALQELLLNETYLEFLPANFGRLVNLKILELRLNNLVTLPKSMNRLINLKRIDIGGNDFNELPEVVGELKQLRELWIDFNQIRHITPQIFKLRELQHFEANGNLINKLPNEISNWDNIEVLSICTNCLDTLPFSVGMMKSLVTFKCEINELRELPDSISYLENLEELVLSHNKLLCLPNTIGMLRKLRFLFADDNELLVLPKELCSCSALSVLSVSQNKIKELPQNIGHLTKLKVLNLVNNCVSTLPVSILSLVNLTSLWISDNQSKPLVPLQYLDPNTKSQLTCFMLPQVGLELNENSIQKNEANAHHLNYKQNNQNFAPHILEKPNSQYYYQQHPLSTCGVAANSPARASPSKKICFAEEAIILGNTSNNTFKDRLETGNENQELNGLVHTNGLICTGDQQQEVRLMRSPTPHPKELRLMAKFLKNGNKKLTLKNQDHVPNIKPTYDRTNARSNCDIVSNSNYNDISLLQSSSSSQIENKFSNTDNYTNILQLQKSLNEIVYKTSVQNQNGLLCTTPLSYIDILNQQQLLQQHKGHPNLNEQSQFYNACYMAPLQINFNSIYNNVDISNCEMTDKHEHNKNVNLTNYYISSVNEPQVTASSVTKADSIKTTLETLPQPAHMQISQDFGKNTPKDLINYDASNYEQYQPKQLQLLKPCDEILVTIEPPVTESNQDYSKLQTNTSLRSCDYQNNVCNEYKNSNSSKQTDAITQNIQQIESTRDVTQSNINTYKELNGSVLSICSSDCNSSINKTISQNNSTHAVKNVTCAKLKTGWLFGAHKNPTVKQVTIKREAYIGFEIDKLPHKEGVYVISTIPNTNAAKLLCTNDKILEIDGHDFTNINLNDAKNILLNLDSAINIMLSRK